MLNTKTFLIGALLFPSTLFCQNANNVDSQPFTEISNAILTHCIHSNIARNVRLGVLTTHYNKANYRNEIDAYLTSLTTENILKKSIENNIDIVDNVWLENKMLAYRSKTITFIKNDNDIVDNMWPENKIQNHGSIMPIFIDLAYYRKTLVDNNIDFVLITNWKFQKNILNPIVLQYLIFRTHDAKYVANGSVYLAIEKPIDELLKCTKKKERINNIRSFFNDPFNKLEHLRVTISPSYNLLSRFNKESPSGFFSFKTNYNFLENFSAGVEINRFLLRDNIPTLHTNDELIDSYVIFNRYIDAPSLYSNSLINMGLSLHESTDDYFDGYKTLFWGAKARFFITPVIDSLTIFTGNDFLFTGLKKKHILFFSLGPNLNLRFDLGGNSSTNLCLESNVIFGLNSVNPENIYISSNKYLDLDPDPSMLNANNIPIVTSLNWKYIYKFSGSDNFELNYGLHYGNLKAIHMLDLKFNININ